MFFSLARFFFAFLKKPEREASFHTATRIFPKGDKKPCLSPYRLQAS